MSRGLLIVFVLIACDEDVRAPARPAPEAAAPTRAVVDATPRQVVYDLVAHPERARLRHGDALVLDFGADAGAQYTLGGWRTRTSATHRFGDTDALLLEGVIGEVLLPAESDRASTLFVRARTFGSGGRLTVYLGEDAVKHARLPTDGAFGVVQIDLPEGALQPGENVLQFRVPAVGRDDGVRAGLAIDGIRVGRADGGEPSVDSFSAPPRTASGALRLPAGWSLAWPFERPPGARLELETTGTVRVIARMDGARPQNLGRHTGETFVELPPGEFMEVELRAEEDAVLQAARITTPGESTPRAQTGPPRNVVIFLVDTVRADKLRPFNPETRVRTPGLDAWASRASVFTQTRTQENWTKPSVATLLTGLYPWQHTATSDAAVLPDSAQMLSERLGAAGFHTGAFICNGYVSDAFGFRQGWRSWRNYIREGRRTQARFVAADVLEWLDARDTSAPFFLYVHTIDPHVPYIPPPELLAEYDPEPYEGPIDFTRDRGLLEKIKSNRLHPNARDRVHLEALYDGEITYHDTHFASILQGLERRGLMDDTLIAFTADHGEEFFDHDSVGHGHSLFEELLHVPLVLYVPGAPPARVDEPASLADLVPTVLDALRLPADPELPGRSLLAPMRGERADAPVASVAGFMEGWRALVVGRYKLIQRTHRTAMVFDLEADPHEHHDISTERPLLLRYLRGLLGLVLSGRTDARHRAESTTIDAETEAQLEALGYVGAERPQ